MNAGQDKPQEATSPHGETPGAVPGRLPAILAAHQHWVQTGGKEGKRANLQGADLSFATGLTREQLTSVRLDATTRLPVELKVPAPSPPAVH